MGRLFFKTFYVTFLWILLMVNIIFVFDLNFLITQYGVISNRVDLSTKYFGVSTMINALKNLDNMPIGVVVSKFGKFYNDIQKYAQHIMEVSILDLPNFDFHSGLFTLIPDLLDFAIKIFIAVYGILCYIFFSILTFIYFILLGLNIFFSIIFLMSGYYFSDVPQSLILQSNMLLNIPLQYRFCCC